MLQQLRPAKKSHDGFTLIELLIVIVILGVLAGIVVFGVAQFRQDSTTAACKADMKTVQVAADAYNAKNNKYPADINVLVTEKYLTKAPDGTWTVNSSPVTRNPACPA